MKTKGNNNRLAGKMLIAMIAGIVAGLIFMAIRESVGAASATWQTINNLLFHSSSTILVNKVFTNGSSII